MGTVIYLHEKRIWSYLKLAIALEMSIFLANVNGFPVSLASAAANSSLISIIIYEGKLARQCNDN